MDVTTRAHRLVNRLLENGTLEVDYSVRIGTITTTRTRMKMEVRSL
jgi:hypothetical protein